MKKLVSARSPPPISIGSIISVETNMLIVIAGHATCTAED